MIKYSIVITTKNRLSDLKITLNSLQQYVERDDVELLVYDDGSNDGTLTFLQENYPKCFLHNVKSKGLIYNRNFLNNKAQGEYIISLDDDAHFLSKNPLEEIDAHFKVYKNCGLIALRIFWGIEEPNQIKSNEKIKKVKGFVGCGHVWRKSTWKKTPDYPVWFVFYGEEQYASYQLFKNNIEIYYLPSVLVQHRVNVKSRKKHKDYILRQRRALRAIWYLYIMFYPFKLIPKRILYTFWTQIKTKVVKGDFKAMVAIIAALFDLLINFFKLLKNRQSLSIEEFLAYQKISDTKIYWNPKI